MAIDTAVITVQFQEFTMIGTREHRLLNVKRQNLDSCLTHA